MVATKEMFLEQNGDDNSDKWGVMFKDDTHKSYKHLYGGIQQFVNLVNWSEVMVNEDGEVCAGSI